MAADLYKMQDDQQFPEIRIDKLEFVSPIASQAYVRRIYAWG